MAEIKVTYEDVKEAAKRLANNIEEANVDVKSIYAIPRGGVPVGLLLSELLSLPMVDEPNETTLVVDDLIDSGKTLEKYVLEGYETAVLYRKPHSPSIALFAEEIDGWIEFPWEKSGQEEAQEHFRRILEYLGEDPTREGLLDTPKRYIKYMKEFLHKEPFNFTVFENEGTDEMIVQKDIHFYSLCEHHTAPFFGTAHVAYIPGDKIVGLSKLARTVHHYANRFQNQERITQQIAERLQKELNPKGVAVTLEATHLCMEMRGVKTHGTSTVTTKLQGVFLEEHDTRKEFFDTIRG